MPTDLRTIITEYAANERDIRHVRDEVFICEQRVARDLEFDDRDSHCIHALVYEGPQPIATGRLDVAKSGKIGRVAVLASHRRQGHGRRIMLALESAAQNLDVNRIWFHAQQSAVPFYCQLGYAVCSEPFMEADIEHVVMEKSLPKSQVPDR